MISEFDRMVEFLDASWQARGFIVPCLQGPPGIGKTAAVNQHAANCKAGKVVTIIASQVLPNEVSGITMPVEKTKSMEIFDHYRLSSLEDGDILFFDELLEADQLVLSACLTLIESRMMMSGKILPDIQIVAATNATVKPTMLKESIRQRFLWQEFKQDNDGVAAYIEQLCGFKPPADVLVKLTCRGDEYNILTPRSLTKMCQWIAESDGDEKVAEQIDRCWRNQIGTKLRESYLRSETLEIRARKAMREATEHALGGHANIAFEDASIADLMAMITELPEWPEIEKELASMQIDDQVIIGF